MKPSPPPESVVVLIDYENVQRTATRRFLQIGADRGKSGHINPRKLAELLVAKRKRPSYLLEARAYRGRPSPHHQPTSTAANDRQHSDWCDAGVTVVRRNLSYPDDWPSTPPTEKGIDVALAVDAVRLAALRRADTIIIVSHDKDLLPAVETIIELPGCHVEVAAWSECHRLKLDASTAEDLSVSIGTPWCHFLSEQDFNAVRDPVDYTKE
ncbi:MULTISPECIES: NYN domain-containing protein [Dermacoccus]|uniref:NYN domain-containing protein n=2 Tax=Dermacoccus TaxID=57495 RepID=A0A417Z1W8_9MICO|nr:NYN domain-containing protein [Dermacoccus abyssi]RHW44012.1 NYN domain-containing protein [Dermacoccus abyssi]